MLVALTFLVVVVGVVVGGIFWYSRRINGAWAAAAGELGLRYTGGNLISGPKITGTSEALPVEVTTLPERSNGYTLTQTTVEYPSLGVGFRLEGELAMHQTSTGDEAFEDRFTIITEAPEQVRAALTPARQRTLVELLDSHPGLVATDTALSLTTKGTATDPEALVATIRDFVAAAQTLGDG